MSLAKISARDASRGGTSAIWPDWRSAQPARAENDTARQKRKVRKNQMSLVRVVEIIRAGAGGRAKYANDRIALHEGLFLF